MTQWFSLALSVYHDHRRFFLLSFSFVLVSLYSPPPLTRPAVNIRCNPIDAP